MADISMYIKKDQFKRKR